jgi:hypothetical protein
MAPLPEKSPDLGNSSPVPRALMYVASLQTSGRHHHHTDDQDEDGDQSWVAAVKIERMERLLDFCE